MSNQSNKNSCESTGPHDDRGSVDGGGKSDIDNSGGSSSTCSGKEVNDSNPKAAMSLCTATLMGFAADSFANSSLVSAFGNGGHQHPLNHQVGYETFAVLTSHVKMFAGSYYHRS